MNFTLCSYNQWFIFWLVLSNFKSILNHVFILLTHFNLSLLACRRDGDFFAHHLRLSDKNYVNLPEEALNHFYTFYATWTDIRFLRAVPPTWVHVFHVFCLIRCLSLLPLRKFILLKLTITTAIKSPKISGSLACWVWILEIFHINTSSFLKT